MGGTQESSILLDAINQAYYLGVVLIGAAGNDGRNENFYPAFYPQVISISATTEEDTLASYSNYGSQIDLAAPGGGSLYGINARSIISLRADSTDIYCQNYLDCEFGRIEHTDMIVGTNLDYYRAVGTSMAAPHVSGLASLILMKNPLLTNEQVKTIMVNSAEDLGVTGEDDKFGNGRIYAVKALQLLISSPSPSVTPSVPSQSLTLSKAWIPFGLTVDKGGNYTAEDLIRDINSSFSPPLAATSSAVSQVMRYYQGRSEVHIKGMAANNFNIKAGEGYLLRGSQIGTSTLSGDNVSSYQINITNGFSLISLPKPVPGVTTAASFIQYLNNQGLNITDLLQSVNGAWVSYQTNNFNTEQGKSYMIRNEEEGKLITF